MTWYCTNCLESCENIDSYSDCCNEPATVDQPTQAQVTQRYAEAMERAKIARRSQI